MSPVMSLAMKSFVRFIRTAGLGLLLLAGVASTAAAGTRLRVCTHNLPPHTFPDAAGKPSGLASDVLLAIAAKLDWQLEVTYSTWLRARADTEHGNCDLIYTLLKKPEYEEFVEFPEQYLADRFNVLLVRKNSKVTYTGDLEAFLRHYSVGLYRDKAVSPTFDKLRNEPWVRLEYAMTSDSVMKMLLAGRMDAAIENSATAIYELRTMGRLQDVEILYPPLLVTPAYIGFSKKGKALPLVQEFDRSLKAFKSTADYRAIIDRYELPPN